jgi:hypothetical protein
LLSDSVGCLFLGANANAAAVYGEKFMLAQYENGLQNTHAEFSRNAAIIALFDGPIESDRLEAFLIHFCSIGVAMSRHQRLRSVLGRWDFHLSNALKEAGG